MSACTGTRARCSRAVKNQATERELQRLVRDAAQRLRDLRRSQRDGKRPEQACSRLRPENCMDRGRVWLRFWLSRLPLTLAPR